MTQGFDVSEKIRKYKQIKCIYILTCWLPGIKQLVFASHQISTMDEITYLKKLSV